MIIEAGSVVVNETEQGNRGYERGEYSTSSVGGEKLRRCSDRSFTCMGQWQTVIWASPTDGQLTNQTKMKSRRLMQHKSTTTSSKEKERHICESEVKLD